MGKNGGDDGINFFDNFTHSIAASAILIQKAHDDGSFIEALVLFASSIDGFLRNLVALKTGKPNPGEGSISLDPRYFYHDESKWMNERNIYKEALGCGVIDTSTFNELERLFRFRNIIIHRFIISGISYAQISPELTNYEIIYNKLHKQLEIIEKPGKLNTKDHIEATALIVDKILRL